MTKNEQGTPKGADESQSSNPQGHDTTGFIHTKNAKQRAAQGAINQRTATARQIPAHPQPTPPESRFQAYQDKSAPRSPKENQ